MPITRLQHVLENADTAEVSDFLGNIFDAVERLKIDEVWMERTGLMLSAIMPALIWERENEDPDFHPERIPQHFTFDNFVRLSRYEDMPKPLRENLAEYLAQTPGYHQGLYDEDGVRIPGMDGSACEKQHNNAVKIFFKALDLE
jgi:hypothetical protein